MLGGKNPPKGICRIALDFAFSANSANIAFIKENFALQLLSFQIEASRELFIGKTLYLLRKIQFITDRKLTFGQHIFSLNDELHARDEFLHSNRLKNDIIDLDRSTKQPERLVSRIDDEDFLQF